MNRLLCFVVPVVILSSSPVSAQTIEQIDSLLAQRRVAEALKVIDAIPAGSMEETRAVINHLMALPGLPDSLFNARIANAMPLAADYDAGNAGSLSASFYANMQKLHAFQRASAAYECFVLARYFRTKHVREELGRLRNNLSLTYGYVASEEFNKADTLLGVFGQEQRTYAFRIIQDSLRRAYEWLRPQIEDGKREQRREHERSSISKHWYVTGGAGMNPSVRLDEEKFPLTEIEPKEYAVWDVPRMSINTMAILLCLEGGYYISPRTSVGVSFARWKETFRNLVKNRWKGGYFPYDVAIEYMRADVFVKYRVTDKTGPRLLLTAGLGTASRAISSEDVPGAQHILRISGRKSTIYRLMLGGGLEYVFSENNPVFLSCNGLAYLNSGQPEILNRFTFEGTLQIGVML